MVRTLFDKIWDAHVVTQKPGHPAILYIDLHLIHEVTSPQAFTSLRERGVKVRCPHRTLGTMDHSTPTDPELVQQVAGVVDALSADGPLRVIDNEARLQLEVLADNCREHQIPLYALGSPHNGIVHVVGPEQGRTLPGMTIVCGDSHTSTHGAFGALAFGIGTSEVEAVLATQCLLQHRPRPVEVRFSGRLQPGVTAKDMILALIAQIGTDGGIGSVFEYTGEAVRALDMEGRMTLCNMSIEAGARAGLVAPDEITYTYLADKPQAPKGEMWERSLKKWEDLRTDDVSAFVDTIHVDASAIAPMVTYGTNPSMAVPIDGRVPVPAEQEQGEQLRAALSYMDLHPGQAIAGQPIDVAFLGSCTNSRLSDLRGAAQLLKSRRVSERVRMLVVPGSQEVKAQAEAEGLDRIFVEAGAEWRAPGCSMCLAMNDDRLSPGMYAVSTSNRNFEGRQGPGSRTFLASPATVAASAIEGRIADARLYMETEG